MQRALLDPNLRCPELILSYLGPYCRVHWVRHCPSYFIPGLPLTSCPPVELVFVHLTNLLPETQKRIGPWSQDSCSRSVNHRGSSLITWQHVGKLAVSLKSDLVTEGTVREGTVRIPNRKSLEGNMEHIWLKQKRMGR